MVVGGGIEGGGLLLCEIAERPLAAPKALRVSLNLTARWAAKDIRTTSLVRRITAGFIGIASS